MAEYLILAQASKQHFYTEPMKPEGGSIALPTKPGIGYDLDETKIESKVEMK
jgi:L-alanine-DL-glutamate epimerase-like enolase superfamily enzyme